MSKQTPLPPVLDELLDSLNGPPTDAYLAEIEQAAKRMAAGEGTSSGGKIGAAKSAETRRGPKSKNAAILAAATKYGDTISPAQEAAIARRTGSTRRWVREVLARKKAEG